MNGKLRVWWSVLGLSLSAPAQIIGPVTAPDPGLIYNTQEGGACSSESSAGVEGADFGAKLALGGLIGPTTGAGPLGATTPGPTSPTTPSPNGNRPSVRGPHQDPHAYGAGFAFAHGTVQLSNGAFVTPLTLLALPCDVGNMGLLLRATYRSDASSQELAPFGPGWFLSGYDFLKSNGEQQAGDPVTLVKGTGEQFTYTWNGSSYVSPDGSFDLLQWTGDPQAPLSGNKFSRLLPDGRRIWYQPVQVQGLYRWVREKVVDLYGNQITYAYDNLTSWPAKQTSITDARAVRVVFTWTGSVITDIHLDTSTLPNLDPQLQSADDVKLLFEYGTSSLLEKLRFFPTTVVRDVNGSGFIDLPGEQFDSTRPTVQFVYGAPGNRLLQMVDVTFSGYPETLLTVGYDATTGRVTQEVEGPDNAAPPFPTHKFAWPAGQPVEYTDPRSTLNRLTLDAQGRVTRVEMNASTSADGMPRQADNFTDYAQLVWQITYSQGCGCRLPLLIVTPENRQWTYAWDTARGLLLQVSSGNRSESWTYDTWSHGSIPLTYVDPAQKTWSTSYSFHSGTNAVSQATISTPQWTDAGGAGQTAITRVLSFSTRGRLTSIADGEGTRTDFVYNGSTGMGRYFLQKVVHDPTGANLETLFTLDDLGRLKQVESGAGTGRLTSYVTNLYQMVEQTVRQVSTSPAYTIASEVYRDRRNNAMVARIQNKPPLTNPPQPDRQRGWIVSEMRYDTMDRVISIKRDSAAVDDASPLYLTHTLDYTPDHILTRVILPHGAVNRYITDGYGLSYKTILDEGSGKLNVVPVRYFYNRDGDLTQVRDGNNHITTITVNAFGEPEAVANPLDGLVRLTRDTLGRVTAQKGIKVQVPELVLTWSEQVFDELGQVSKSKRHLLDISGSPVKTEETLYFYNKRGQVVRIEQPLGRGATIEYDSAGRPRLARDRLHASDPLLQNQVEFTYEAVTGRLWKRTSREVEAGDFGAQPGSGSQIDYVEQFTYDLMDRVLTSTRKAATGSGQADVLRTFLYDSLSHTVKALDTLGAGRETRYDALGRSRSIKRLPVPGSGSATIEMLLDFLDQGEAGNGKPAVKRWDGISRLTSYVFDPALRLSEVRNPGYVTGQAVHRTLFEYDPASNVEFLTDGNGTRVQQSFDAANRLLTRQVVNLGAGLSVLATKETFSYDAVSRLLTTSTFWGIPSTNPLVDVFYSWDSLGRAQSEMFTYLAGITGAPSPRTVTSSYEIPGTSDVDFAVRRGLTYPSGFAMRYGPDGLGRVRTVEMAMPNGGAMNPLAEYRHVGARPLERKLHYNTATSDWQSTLFTWDGQKRLTTLLASTSSGATVSRFDFSYDVEGNLLKQQYRRLGTQDTNGGDLFQNDGHYRLRRSKTGVPGSQFGIDPQNTSAFDGVSTYAQYLQYGADAQNVVGDGYDNGNNRTLVKKTDQGQSTQTTAYGLDSLSSRYTSVGGVTFAYDNEGNLLYDGNLIYIYDFKNRLSEVYRYVPAPTESALMSSGPTGRPVYAMDPDKVRRLRPIAQQRWLSQRASLRSGFQAATGSAAVASDPATTGGSLQLVAYYGYDPFNRRIYRAVAGQSTLYSVYDGWRELEEVAHDPGGPQNQVERVYTWGKGLDELLSYTRRTGPGNWQRLYVHQDRMGSVTRLVNDQGAAVEGYEYDAYGAARVFSIAGTVETPITGSAYGNPYLFTGRRRDEETGLAYLRTRYYQAAVGRFLTVDSIGLWGDRTNLGNGYIYVGNRPGTFIDPLGLVTLSPYDPSPVISDDPIIDLTGGKAPCRKKGKDEEGLVSLLKGSVAEGYAAESHVLGTGWSIYTWPGGGGMAYNEDTGEAGTFGPGDLGPIGLSQTEAAVIAGIAIAVAAFPVAWAAAGLVEGCTAGLACTGGAAAVRMGQMGEAAVRRLADIGEKLKIVVNGRVRIPDGLDLTNGVLSEVKNVERLSLTRQLRDFLDYARENGLQFDLWVRQSTRLSGPLLELTTGSDPAITLRRF